MNIVDSLLDLNYSSLNTNTPLSVSFRRVQKYRDFIFVAKGTLWYDSTCGLVIQYVNPFVMWSTYTDSMVQYVNLKKKTPFQRSLVEGVFDSDPFQCLLALLQLQPHEMVLKGSYDSLILFNGSSKQFNSQVVFHRDKKICLEYLFIDTEGAIVGKANYYYKKKRSFPVAVTYRKAIQGFLLVDSVSIGRIETNVNLPQKVW